MGKNTKIAWATSSWNPFIGCSKVSPACDNCYAERWAKQYRRDFTKVVRSNSTTFNSPKTWVRPERIFVCSLSDFFHPDILRFDRHAAIKVMRDAPQHTYLLLTKRPDNIRPMLLGTAWGEGLPKNVWLGVTVENQEQADKRIPLLLEFPAALRFVSCEPLLGPLNLVPYLAGPKGHTVKCGCGWCETEEHVMGSSIDRQRCYKCGKRVVRGPALNWVISGGESGPGARPTHPAWALKLRDDCYNTMTPFMFKQWGEWRPVDKPWEQDNPLPLGRREQWLNLAGGQGYHGDEVWRMEKCGVGMSGRELDGFIHNCIPANPL